MNEEKTSKDNPTLQYLKLNSSNKYELLSEKEYSKEINILPKMFNEDISVKEEKITKFLNIILPETKENDILKMNFALSSWSKKNKANAQQCLNDLMNLPEVSNLILNRDLASKFSQIIKEIFRRIKKYSHIKTYDELIQTAREFQYKGGNIINKFMIEINENEDEFEVINEDNFNNSAKNLSNFSKILERNNNLIKFKFVDIKKEKKKSLPAEMRCLIKKFSIIKKFKLSLNNKNHKKSDKNSEEFAPSLTDIQNIIIILYNSEWLFQNLLEIEIDLSNDSLLQSFSDIQRKNLKKFSELLNKDIELSLYHFGLDKNIIFNPYQLSGFYFSFTKSEANKDNFLFLYENLEKKNILSYELKDECDNDYKRGMDEFINDKKYILEMIIVYAYFLLKLKNIRICYLIQPINYKEEIIQILKNEKIAFEDFNLFGFFKENYIHHFTIDFNSLDSLSFQNVLNFISQNGLLKIFRINFFKSEEYFKSEMLYKILEINEKKYQNINIDNFHYDDENEYVYDLKINESFDNYLLRKLYDKFQKNISYFFYLITMRTNINELSIIFDIPNKLVNNNRYITLIQKLILNLIAFIDSAISNLTILSIQAESLELNGRKCIYLEKFFDKLNLYKNPDNKVKSLTIQCQIYKIINIHKLIPYGIEYLSLGSFDLNTFIFLVNYLTSIDFSEHSKLKKLQINLNNTIFKYEECKEYYEQLLIEHPRNLTQISIYSHLIIDYFQLKNLLLKSNYNIIENIFLSFNKNSLKDEGYKEKLKPEEYNKNIIIIPNFLDLYYNQRKRKNTKIIIELINILSNKINKSFNNYNIFLNIEKFMESIFLYILHLLNYFC